MRCDAQIAQGVGELQIQRFGLIGFGRARKARAVAAAGVGGQRELADHKGRAAGLQDRQVHLVCLVLEQPQLRDFQRQRAGGVEIVLRHGTDQDQQAGAGGTDLRPVYLHRSLGDPLQQRAHQSFQSMTSAGVARSVRKLLAGWLGSA